MTTVSGRWRRRPRCACTLARARLPRRPTRCLHSCAGGLTYIFVCAWRLTAHSFLSLNASMHVGASPCLDASTYIHVCRCGLAAEPAATFGLRRGSEGGVQLHTTARAPALARALAAAATAATASRVPAAPGAEEAGGAAGTSAAEGAEAGGVDGARGAHGARRTARRRGLAERRKKRRGRKAPVWQVPALSEAIHIYIYTCIYVCGCGVCVRKHVHTSVPPPCTPPGRRSLGRRAPRCAALPRHMARPRPGRCAPKKQY